MKGKTVKFIVIPVAKIEAGVPIIRKPKLKKLYPLSKPIKNAIGAN